MDKVELRIHEVMGRHRIKQSELAVASGVHYTTLSGVYSGKIKRLDLETLAPA